MVEAAELWPEQADGRSLQLIPASEQRAMLLHKACDALFAEPARNRYTRAGCLMTRGHVVNDLIARARAHAAVSEHAHSPRMALSPPCGSRAPMPPGKAEQRRKTVVRR